MDLLLIFVSGLTLGGLTCSVIQVGLFSSLFAQGMHSRVKIASSVSIYIVTRLVGAVLLGLLLGFLGETAVLSGKFLYGVQFLAGVIMILTAISFLPIKRLPTFWAGGSWNYVSRLVQGVFRLKHQWVVVPVFFGLASFFIPCGATLAIEAQALSTGSPLYAALTLSLFVIGTIPAFLGMSLLGKILSAQMRQGFYAVMGLFLLVLGIATINGVLVLFDSPVTLQKIAAYSPFYIDDGSEVLSGEELNGVRSVPISITDNGYAPGTIWVSSGDRVKLLLTTKDVYNCASVFRIPALGISKALPVSGTEVVEFVANVPEDLYFSCSTGLKTGVIHVIS